MMQGVKLDNQNNTLTDRVVRAAEAALAANGVVSPIDVLVGMRLLAQSNVEAWKKGRIERLEELIQGSVEKISASMKLFTEWAQEKGLTPGETRYTRSGRNGKVDLQVSYSGHPEVEKFFRTQYISPALPQRKQQQLAEKQAREADPVVFEIVRDSKCSECDTELWKGSLLFMDAGQPLCLACAHLADLEYLPAGDAALTRRATKYSARKAVVVRFSRSRGHYERQGILLEPAAIEKAEQECLDDADERAKARASGAAKRKQEDRALVTQMIERIQVLFPGCPPKEAAEIATHTAARGSGRVGRTAAGRSLEDGALSAAVTAAVRHRLTGYDELLAKGRDRGDAREQVAPRVRAILAEWRR